MLHPDGETAPAIATVVRARPGIDGARHLQDQEFAEATASVCVVMKFSDCDTGSTSMTGLRHGLSGGSLPDLSVVCVSTS
jgi:hypothetical protein